MDPNNAKSGPLSATSEMTFRWRADAGSTLNSVLVEMWFSKGSTKDPYSFVIFQGVRTPYPSSSGSAYGNIVGVTIDTINNA